MDQLSRKALWVLTVMGLLAIPTASFAQEAAQQWELVNPEGSVQVPPMPLAPRIASLEGKTVLLRWNGKPNGNVLLDRVAELLVAKVKGVKIIKAYETNPETSIISHGPEKGKEIAKKLAGLNPDLVIASQGD